MTGEPVNRIDGPLQVTGRAAYSYERHHAGPALDGYIVAAAIAQGRVAGAEA